MVRQDTVSAEVAQDLFLRYQRQLHLPEWGISQQKKLGQTRVLLVGMGGLGCPVALYLCAAGVGTLGLMDDDLVSLSNLQRQVLYTPEEIGLPKVHAAKQHLSAFNPEVNLHVIEAALDINNAIDHIANFDIIVDCSDNLAVRYLINDTCQVLKKPWVYGSVYRFEGQVACFLPEPGCYRCIYPAPAAADVVPSCTEAGVLGTVPAFIAQLQATEVLRLVGEWGPGLSQHLLLADLKAFDFHKLQRPVDKACRACGAGAVMDLSHLSETLALPLMRADEYAAQPIQALDIRDDKERQAGYLPGLHLAMDALLALSQENLLQVLNPRVPLLVYCQKGLRSAQAVVYLQSKGFSQIYSLQGGYERWESYQARQHRNAASQ